MKKIIYFGLLTVAAVFLSLGATEVVSAKTAEPIRSIKFTDVEITDGFWSPFIERNRTVSIPQILKAEDKPNHTPDTRLIEAAAYLLAKQPDKQLEKQIEVLCERAANEFLTADPQKKWTNLLDGELFFAGHYFEAAVAFYEATGNKNVLNTASKIADDIDSVFGPDKRRDVSGHEELKIGLLRLYHATGNKKYYKLAKFFLDERGNTKTGRRLHGEYAQDHKPVIKQERAIGHCVRAVYLYTPLAEIARISEEPAYAKASETIWNDAVSKRMYLIGNYGSHRDFEDFGDDYELPNISCWNETCSAIGNIYWNQKMFELTGDAKYIDIMERCLYNGFLAAVSLDGEKYFYQNVLETIDGFERYDWFGPNCCPPNLARLIASLGNYIYATGEDAIFVNLFIASSAKIQHGDNTVIISQETNYPWDGNIKIKLEPQRPAQGTMHIRIPCWARGEPVPSDLYRYIDKNNAKVSLKVNGKPVKVKVRDGFASIERRWEKGDVVTLDLPMPVRLVAANKKVTDNEGRAAIERGPLVYCAESIDNGGNVFDKYVPDNSVLKSEFRKDTLGGVSVIKGQVQSLGRGEDKKSVVSKKTELTAIPYYAWANRAKGQMTVWLARGPETVFLPPVPSIASTSTVSSSCGKCTIEDNYPGGNVPTVAKRFFPRSQSGAGGFSALYDQIMPVSSADGSCPFLNLRPQQGDSAWVQYDFAKKTRISSAKVYWKDDREYCIMPKSWRLVYWQDGQWVPVKNRKSYKVEKDKFNTVTFEPVEAEKLRLEIQLQGQKFAKGALGPPDANYLKDELIWYECGILEWQVN